MLIDTKNVSTSEVSRWITIDRVTTKLCKTLCSSVNLSVWGSSVWGSIRAKVQFAINNNIDSSRNKGDIC